MPLLHPSTTGFHISVSLFPFTLPTILQLYNTSHRASSHTRWPFSKKAGLLRPCVLVVGALAREFRDFF